MRWPEAVLMVIERLTRAGYEAYAVGGCVRDALLGRAPGDWDVCTSARPDEMKAVFEGERVIETGIRHGTLTVLLLGLGVEVTTFRAEGAYTDHRRPDAVRFVSCLRDDLSRRDFTINAMALRPGHAVIDYFGGRRDLKGAVIRCVGDPEERFSEDALRIMRALRCASQLDFLIEEDTARAVIAMRGELSYVSAERVYAELKRLVVGPGAARVLGLYGGVLDAVLKTGDYDPETVGIAPPDAELRLAMLLRGTDARAAMQRLRADNSATKRVVLLSTLSLSEPPRDERGAIALLHAAGGPALARDVLTVQRALGRDVNRAEVALDKVIRDNACYRLRDLAVNGDDLLELGVQKGRALGQTLETLLARVMAGELVNEKTALLQAAGGLTNACNDDRLSGSTRW